MSRTYRNKIRHGLFAGSNTAWYRARTRWLRNKHHHELRTALQYIEPDEVLYNKFFDEVSEKIEKVILHIEAEYHENEDSAQNTNN